MRWSEKGYMVPTTIEEAAAMHYAIAAHCRCGNWASFDSHGLWWRFTRKHWDQRMNAAKLHFFCWKCWAVSYTKQRPIKLEPVKQAATDVQLPMPPEHEWKRAMRRVR